MAEAIAIDVDGRVEAISEALAVGRRARTAIFAVILLAMLLAGLDQTVVGTALPRIVTDLQGSDRYVWVVTAYLLSSTVSVPVYGKLSDVYGRKSMLLVGVGLFLIGSGLSGLSQTMDQLIGFRALQGLGAGAVFPVATATIADLFSPRERGRAQGMFGAVFGLSFLIGPFIGGWITDHISWHWVFYVNVPPGLVALLAFATLLPNRRLEHTRAGDLDYLGIAVFVAAVVPILIGLTNMGEVDPSTGQLYAVSTARVGGLLGLGVVMMLLFLFAETRARQPMIPLDLFKNRDYALSMSAAFVFGMAGFVAAIFMPRFYQTVRGISATTSGYYLWPLLTGLMAGSIGGGMVITRFGRYKWLITGSSVLVIVGGFLMTHLGVSTPDWTLWTWMALLGLGVGPSLSAFTVVVQSVAPMRRMGAASSTLVFLRQIGATIGLAVAETAFSTIFQNQLPSSLAGQGLPADVVSTVVKLSQALEGVGSGARVLARILPPSQHSLIPQIVAGANKAFAIATGEAFWMVVIAGTFGLIITLGLRDSKLKQVRSESVAASSD